MAKTTHDTQNDPLHLEGPNGESPGEKLPVASGTTAVQCKSILYADPEAVERADARIARKFFRMFRKLAE